MIRFMATERSAYTGLAALALSGLLLAPLSPAMAAESEPESEASQGVASSEAQDILFEGLQLSSTATDSLSELVKDTQKTDSGVAVTEQTMIVLPTEEDTSATSFDLLSGESISIEIPGAVFEGESGGAATLNMPEEDSLFVVHTTVEGTTQIVNTVTEPTEAHSFSVDTEIPAGSQWKKSPEGSLYLVDSNEQTLMYVDQPWSIDASGKRLPRPSPLKVRQ